MKEILERGFAPLKDLLSSELGRLRGANAPLSTSFPLSFEGEGDKGSEADKDKQSLWIAT